MTSYIVICVVDVKSRIFSVHLFEIKAFSHLHIFCFIVTWLQLSNIGEYSQLIILESMTPNVVHSSHQLGMLSLPKKEPR